MTAVDGAHFTWDLWIDNKRDLMPYLIPNIFQNSGSVTQFEGIDRNI